jgi:hypothetical protein
MVASPIYTVFDRATIDVPFNDTRSSRIMRAERACVCSFTGA